ncbi:MAG: bifunctional 5,10-methylene-tetrahydrofolate dehydrogenase/5,10-methylene-tetrahydrofolate cyclohydrolase [Bacteroidales bacterium]|jgi:methylenetetrahydrofolate dehydrogenase (NADP+)/methenyltetrahydrofolate cyclohydrolase|nr:bifunctional 5,10-methylene-tetrahydrofolate dehydrogenase/5,10-methylene-tetrahydrofolate cyclohydrolase [Bacteroidales bacterium]
MKLLDGKLIAGQIKSEIATEVNENFLGKGLNPPHIAAMLVGDDPASKTYVSGKEKACREVGFLSSVYKYAANVSEEKLLEAVDFLNNDPEVDGFIVQLPLPEHINEQKITERIDPRKDIDGFHPVNIGKMVLELPCFIPATPYGIITLLDRYDIETEGKNCVVLGRSHIVGTPISILLSRKSKRGNATVTLCHSFTQDIASIASKADILIVAMGKQGFVTADMVKNGAVVVDVGIHRIPSEETKSGYILKGDVDFEKVSRKCSYITPVPGGVGLMTIVSLLQNGLKAAKKIIV